MKVLADKQVGMEEKYPKLEGWMRCKRLGIATIENFYIVEKEEDIRKISTSEYPFFIRADAKGENRFRLPRGRDLLIEEIPQYLFEIKSICSDAVLLVSEHPSIQTTGHYISKIQGDGGVMIRIEKNNEIVIEYVGPGFDVGEISRAKSVHTVRAIPWVLLDENILNLYRYAKHLGTGYDIAPDVYRQARKERLDNLKKLKSIGEQESWLLEKSIPIKAKSLDYKLFKKIYIECIEKLLDYINKHTVREISIMGNIYENNVCYFEVLM